MNKRNLQLDKYGISSKRYKELCGFCEQYPDWKADLLVSANNLQGVQYSDMPKNPNTGTSDPTGNTAVRDGDRMLKCDLIERVAKQALPDYWEAIIKSVCYEVSVTYLINYEQLPMSKSSFYEYRRYFFYLLDKEKK